MASIEAVVSSRKKTNDQIRTESLIPGAVRDEAAELIELLEEYYKTLDSTGNPGSVISSLEYARDLDDTTEEYQSMLKREIASTVPNNTIVDKVKLYKDLSQFYSVKGSQESILLFFKILFNDNVEVYYPKDDLLIPSSGNWDADFALPGGQFGKYLDSNGFLSDIKKLQDSAFYQKFSYVIRTGNNVDKWKDAFNRLVHPAGFVFFGQILIILEMLRTKAAMPYGKVNGEFLDELKYLQPGMIYDEDLPLLILLGFAHPDQPNIDAMTAVHRALTIVLRLEIFSTLINKTTFAESIGIGNGTPVGELFDLTPTEYINNFRQQGTNITIS